MTLEQLAEGINSMVTDANRIIKFLVVYIGILWALLGVFFTIISNQIEKAKQEILDQISKTKRNG